MLRFPHLLLVTLVVLGLTASPAAADGPVLTQPTGGLTVSTGNAAVLAVHGLVAGTPQASEVTLTNGAAPAGVALAASAVIDVAGIEVAVEDVTTGRPLYAGPLSGLASLDLGTLAASESRRYRFTVTARVPLLALLSSVTLTWTSAPRAGVIDPGARPPGLGIASTSVRAPKATLSARASRTRVTATVTCSTGCELRLTGIASRGGAHKRLRTVTRKLVRAGQARIVVKLPAGRQRASVSLSLKATLGPPALTVRRTVRVLAAR